MSELSDIMGYESPFGEDSLFNESEWKKRLESYLEDKSISEFVYSNTSTIDGTPVTIRIYGRVINGKLGTQAFVKHDNDFIATNSDLKYLKNANHFLVYKKMGKWQLCDKSIDHQFISTIIDSLVIGNRKLNDDEYRQIYYEFQDCKSNINNNQKKKFDQFSQNINKQLANKFYSGLDIAVYVKLVDEKGKVIRENTLKTNYKNKKNDIKLNITLNPDGSLKINHVFRSDYLKEYEEKWKKEAQSRGLEVDMTAMRQDIISYLNSQEAEKTFSEKFLREVRTWWDDGVGNYLEAIQATQKVTSHIWKEGTINRGIWHSVKEDALEYRQWPEYMHLQPVLGGATDGVIDEIVGIPLACKSIYEIAADDEKRKAFAQVFTKEGFANLLEGLENQALGILNDSQRQQHFGGQTVISIASIFAGTGAVTKVGKLDELGELVEVAVKKGDEFVDGVAALSKIDELKKLARHLDGERVFDDLVEEFDISTIENRLDDLINEARSIDQAKRADFWKNARKFILRGNKFNEIVRAIKPPKYKFHEVVIEHPTLKYLDGPNKGKPQRFRLDSYTHKKYIVSRKATDFDRIKPETFRGYLDELLKKYPPGAKIVSIDKEIRYRSLTGELIMEVPLSNKTSKRIKEFEKIMRESKYKQITLVFEKE